ncbi:3-carboxy-cis,cis-muconate cycloisomerase [Frankia sp. CNm7]|uniref:3-carboxy-cis,cis-muconate cycloisomerase n=1 Tax=Frankia nepalensis TaxID=1836974 RepID=A0A937RNN4_9ACTN|nr:lyase family protein [Frankia nepalensis]MBL7495725.1 3-carboxy-cis,cis-muconate cycloisomerase [Frankia nepalensis]MBL7508999.1 3-carboxy-cis,cis-muconate cycloisomerase [Frankia nepalensis]MBL7523679.1 3-carboxy-cis,cis-muconate cycloisomerase [Frankia nepalensis]MBL7629798.1 3-carboxy-cis,cis-muconate cycloisomerase [Frankia nepalensis]
MSDLFWPGDEHAGDLATEASWLAAMARVEQAWLDALARAGIAPATVELAGLVSPDELPAVARAAEGTGNPVPALVALWRGRARGPGAAWVHRGLTSQDVIDTSLVLLLRDAVKRVLAQLRGQVGSLVALADAHRGTVIAGRTLTQHAVPTTFGLKAAGWLTGILDAADALGRLALPAQFGGAAGTLSAAVELARLRGAADPAGTVSGVVADATSTLGLRPVPAWHTTRGTFTAIGDALVACTDAWGRIATDVATLSRPEIGELAEPAADGRGGSSTMPHKRNPVLSVLIRRAALTAPALASTLHLAAALAGDERPDGAWHTEWPTLRDLARRAAVAAHHTSELLRGLRVEDLRMGATAAAAWRDLTAERRAMAAFAGGEPADDPYLGLADGALATVLARANAYLEATR